MDRSATARLRRTLEAGEWSSAAQVAALMFLTLLAAGAALLLAGKLQFASLGAGADPFAVLRAIGLVALACLGVTIDIGDLSLSVIPLGLLTLVALAGVRFVREVAEPNDSITYPFAPKVGAVFGAICAIAAGVFRFGGDVPVSAAAIDALALGFLWGSAIAVGGIARGSTRRQFVRLRRVADGPLGDGARVTLRIGRWAAYGSLVSLLALVIARLAADPLPRRFGIGDALAALLYLIAFLPNALVAIFALAIGATLRVGAQIGVGGRLVGPLREQTLLDPGGGGPPTTMLVIVLLPLAVFVGAGVWAATRSKPSRHLAATLGFAASIAALAMGALAALGDARLGAGLVRERGVGLVAVDSTEAALLAALWTIVAGGVGAGAYRWIRRRRGEGRT